MQAPDEYTMAKLKKYTLLLILPLVLSGCSTNMPGNNSDRLMKIPIALLTYENQYVSFSEEQSHFDLQPSFDSTCLFHLVSLNKDMLTKIKLVDQCFLADLSGKGYSVCASFEKAGVYQLVDKQGSFAAFKNEAMDYLAINANGITPDTVLSSASMFYLMYNPDERHTHYKIGKSIEDYQKELSENEALKVGLMDKAQHRGLSLEDIILLDAIWLYEKNDAFNFADQRKLMHYHSIKNNKDMMRLIADKAEERGVSIPRMTWMDAEYLFRQEVKADGTSP